MPARINVRLPYFENAQLIDEAANVSYMEAVYRLNSLFSPNGFSGSAAHQPRGFDQWAALYSRYLVKGCKWEVDPYIATNAAADAYASNIVIGTVASTEGAYAQFGSVQAVMEYPQDSFFRYKNLSRSTTMVSAENPWSRGAPGGAKMKGYVSMHQQYKMWRGIDFTSGAVNHIWPQDYTAGIGASPAAEVQLTIWAGSMEQDDAALTSLPNLYANVRLMYYVEFYDPVYPSAS